MKKFIPLAFAAISLSTVASAAPFMAIGDGAELFVTGTLGVRADDNILLGSDAKDKSGKNISPVLSDVIWDINPGLELTFGKNSQVAGSLTLVDAFATYTDHSQYNTNLFSGDFIVKYDDSKMKLDYNIGYHELNQNTVETRGLIRRDIFSSAAHSEIEVSQITSLGAGVSYTHENYHPTEAQGFGDNETLEIPVDVYYKWRPKVELGVGYRYRSTEVTLGQDTDDHFFNVGARGEFSPKLTGKFAIGVNTRRFKNGASSGHTGSSDTQLGLDSSFAYELTPKTNLELGASNDFGTSPSGAQQKNFTVNGRVTTKINEQWSWNAGASYRSIDYGTRTDDYWEGTLGGAFVLNANIRFVGSYVYRNYSSSIASSEFTNNVFSIAANLRY